MNNIEKLRLEGKQTFIRVDFNVPLKNGKVQDDTRIREALPTIEYARKQGAKVILASHLGRPKGKRIPEMSLKPVADYIQETFFPIQFLSDCVGDQVRNAVGNMEKGQVILLENLRFHAGEEKNLPEFVEELRNITQVYVNDAFGTCHRKHASVFGLPQVADTAVMGYLLTKEVNYFRKLSHNPEKPFGVVIGGAKVSSKIGAIKSLMKVVDKMIIGGAMAYTFLAYLGKKTGASFVETDHIDTVKDIYEEAREQGVHILLPVDHVCSETLGGAPVSIHEQEIPDRLMGLDIGPKTIDSYINALGSCRTVFWNGPMGVFEHSDYANGTFSIARFLATSDAIVIVGGGDSVSAVNKSGVAAGINHISTGGGASLEFIEFGTLPGVEILEN